MAGKTNGYTIIEMVITIVITSILAILSVTIYRGYVRRAMAAEGRALVCAVAASQRVHHADTGQFLAVSSTNYNRTLDIDARMNKYFRSFSSTASGSGTGATFRVTAAGAGDAAGITFTLTQTYGTEPVITHSGL